MHVRNSLDDESLQGKCEFFIKFFTFSVKIINKIIKIKSAILEKMTTLIVIKATWLKNGIDFFFEILNIPGSILDFLTHQLKISLHS